VRFGLGWMWGKAEGGGEIWVGVSDWLEMGLGCGYWWGATGYGSGVLVCWKGVW